MADEPLDVDPVVVDQLELELRQLDGVSFVAFAERPASTLVEIGVELEADGEALRSEAARLALVALDGNVVVELAGGMAIPADSSNGRVQLLVAMPVADEAIVRIHLAYRGGRVAVEAPERDRLAVASAVVGGLRELGLAVPYNPVAAHGLSDDLGSGTLVILADPATGQTRRGLASGRTVADSTARSVLSALNRFLQSSH